MSLPILSSLELAILNYFKEPKWYGPWWFPHVNRPMLKIPDGPAEEEIHTALLDLVRSGVLEPGVWLFMPEPITPKIISRLLEDSLPEGFSVEIKEELLPELRPLIRWYASLPPPYPGDEAKALPSLSSVQLLVLRSIDHVGWYRLLWFPEVGREALNLPDGPTNQQLQSALLELIRSGEVLKPGNWAFIPFMEVTPAILSDLQNNNLPENFSLRINEGLLEELLPLLSSY